MTSYESRISDWSTDRCSSGLRYISSVEPSLSGPKRPQDRVLLSGVAAGYNKELAYGYKKVAEAAKRVPVAGESFDIGHGDVVIAAITSCTNTSNPSVLIAAGLVARKARALGLERTPWVKSSLSPASQVVTDHLGEAGLQEYLHSIVCKLVGYGGTHPHGQ